MEIIVPTILGILLYSTLGIQGIFEPTTESRITTSLLHNYNKISRPAPSPSQTVNGSSILTVNLGLILLQIINIDEKKQILTTNVMLRLSWSDNALTWNASEYDNVTDVRIPTSYLWRPDILIYNVADEEIFQSNHYRGSLNAIVFHTGIVLFVPPMIIKTTCQMDVTWFPFDTQRCKIEMGSWTYSGKDVKLEVDADSHDPFDLHNYVENGEWRVLSAKADSRIRTYDCCPEPYYRVVFALHIKRQSRYYFFNLIVPMILIGFLAILGFTLPPDSGEKLSLGVTVLFSLIVFLNQSST